ncbi:MAG: PilZ domain-containing protein [Nitrospiraceae bacterium]|nr:PilZ domain-containing protein [Nitrospiraceae bacterium]
MPQTEPATILVINDIGEEIKLVTMSLRSFFPGCRVEAVYSLDEALQWAPRARWHLLLVDERLLAQRPTPVLPELKRLASAAAIVLQTDHSDAAAAVDALQAGADFSLYKKSPAFLTELVLYTKEAMEKRALRITLERTQERHGRLIDALGDVLYELDAEGRFVYLSPSITALLGYAPEDLAGVPYANLIPAEQMDYARYRFNERRTGSRAARRLRIDLTRKMPAEGSTAVRIPAEVSAKGLYDPDRRFVGTLGLLRDMSAEREQETVIRRLERQLQETDRVVGIARQISTLAKQIHEPLAAVLTQSQQLYAAIQGVKIDQQFQSLLQQATEAVRHGTALAEAAQGADTTGPTVNDLMDAVLAAMHPESVQNDNVERRYAAELPPFRGDVEVAQQLFRTLVSQAQRYVEAMGSRHRLRVTTGVLRPSDPVQIEIRIEETTLPPAKIRPLAQDTSTLFDAYVLIRQLGGRLDFAAPAGGLLSITLQLPVDHPPPSLTHAEVPLSPSASPGATGPLPVTVPQPASSVRSATPLPDRRQATRAMVHLPARITAGNAIREGTVTNLSLGGAGILLEGVLPPLDAQPVYVILKTPVGMLELQGLAQSRVTSIPAGTEDSSTLLAFRFTSETEMERQVLASLVEEAQSRNLSVTLEALLSLPDDVREAVPPPVGAAPEGRERRETLRVRVAMPTRIDTASLNVAAQRPLGLLVNMSRGGACLQMQQAPGAVGDPVALHFSSTGPLGPPKTHEPEAPEAILTARIVWMAPDHHAPSDLRPGPAQAAQRIGIRFVQSTAFAEREINRVVAQHIGSSVDLEGIVGRSSIVSARRESRNARQQVIAITDDHARHQISPTTPVVIIVPGFGKTQTDYLPLSYVLAANRIRVLRYDHTNHVGQSEGDVLHTTLQSMQVDCQTVLDFARSTWPTAPLAILAEDVGARIALRVMALTRARGRLLLANPMLDLQSALTLSYGRDVLSEHHQGVQRGIENLWGYNVNLDHFLGDAVAADYIHLSTSARDLAALTDPPLIFTTRTAPPHISESLKTSLDGLGQKPVTMALSSDLSLQREPYDARHTATFLAIFKQIAASFGLERRSIEAEEPSPKDIERQQTLEHERTCIGHHVPQPIREALWIAHLAQLPHLNNVHEFWGVRDHVYRELLPLEPGMTILDVGCGHGDLAKLIITNQIYRLSHHRGWPGPPLHYVGLEQAEETLTAAQGALDLFMREITGTFALPSPITDLLEPEWVPLDWSSAAPFSSGRAPARVAFHLSLAFCPSPLLSLRRGLEALDEGGILLLTAFQPHTDLSQICRHHLRATAQDELGPSSRGLLHYLGRLREALRHGVLHSYGREQLAVLLLNAGASPIRITPILDGQLLVAVARKGKYSG